MNRVVRLKGFYNYHIDHLELVIITNANLLLVSELGLGVVDQIIESTKALRIPFGRGGWSGAYGRKRKAWKTMKQKKVRILYPRL